MPKTALIVGAGNGLSASLARLFQTDGMAVALAARRIDKLKDLCDRGAMRRLATRRGKAVIY
jgi:NADP-dependent 3-hydroxy acid dehydrogenase YdfG